MTSHRLGKGEMVVTGSFHFFSPTFWVPRLNSRAPGSREISALECPTLRCFSPLLPRERASALPLVDPVIHPHTKRLTQSLYRCLMSPGVLSRSHHNTRSDTIESAPRGHSRFVSQPSCPVSRHTAGPWPFALTFAQGGEGPRTPILCTSPTSPYTRSLKWSVRQCRSYEASLPLSFANTR